MKIGKTRFILTFFDSFLRLTIEVAGQRQAAALAAHAASSSGSASTTQMISGILRL